MPFGQIPAFEDGSLRLYESRAIGRYVASKYRGHGPDLIPAVNDSMGWALLEQFASVEYSQFFDAALPVLWLKVYNPARGIPSDEAAIKSSTEKLHAKMDVLDQILGGQKYLGGPDFTIVDAFYMPAVDALYQAGESEAFEQRPNLSSWWKTVSQRASWQKVSTM
ncbi:hypothetical protein QQS21_006360 [Conoideocrella luteorostrata]|uniref:glutathione transferase n=1 Tax=Conoideocrella luteorostrata TaxID=1105319 RepID=A0AAJ0CMW2_9HYPO|nr:hypothetical protein QQS21_006360 [Conoideocrella luteorostrata]